MKRLLTFFLLISSFNAIAQTGCRRNSDGILFQNLILFGPDYNANSPGPNASALCLPMGTTGPSCTIRIPFTTTSFQGTYGTYSAINCDLDHYVYGALLVAGIFVFRKVRKV